MGRNREYTRMIHALLTFENSWDQIDNNKYRVLMNVLKRYAFNPRDETWETVPGIKQISEDLNMSRLKTNLLIRNLYEDLMETFYEHPPKVLHRVHHISIVTPWEELRSKGKRGGHDDDGRGLVVHLELPETPKVGEFIEIRFLDNSVWTSGYVNEVHHQIDGHCQHISVLVYPSRNEYFRWKRMEEEYVRRDNVRSNKSA
ncbi:MAG: hypothetical protein JXQ96_17720 [Cyclobacteriaceae bacterium]